MILKNIIKNLLYGSVICGFMASNYLGVQEVIAYEDKSFGAENNLVFGIEGGGNIAPNNKELMSYLIEYDDILIGLGVPPESLDLVSWFQPLNALVPSLSIPDIIRPIHNVPQKNNSGAFGSVFFGTKVDEDIFGVRLGFRHNKIGGNDARNSITINNFLGMISGTKYFLDSENKLYLRGGVGLGYLTTSGEMYTNFIISSIGLLDEHLSIENLNNLALVYEVGTGVAINVSQNTRLSLGYLYHGANSISQFGTPSITHTTLLSKIDSDALKEDTFRFSGIQQGAHSVSIEATIFK